MPVITRSQYLNQLKENSNVNHEGTPVRLSCGNGKFRKVLLIDSEISNPPHIPKKAKSSVPKPTGKVCRRLDFEEVMKPETYRSFEINGRSMRGKVDEFYKMCDDYHNEKSKEGCLKNSEVRTNTFQLDGFSDEYLISLARSLLNHDLFINFYKEDAPNDTLNILIESWGTMLTSIYSICFMRMFNRYQILDNLDNLDDVKIISDEIVPLIILFQPIISSDRFSGFGYCKKLLGVIVKKLVEFSAKGVVQAVVAIHKFFPDMVSKDCYPSLKPEKNKVIVDYTESLLDNSKDLCIKTDWMNLKNIYNK